MSTLLTETDDAEMEDATSQKRKSDDNPDKGEEPSPLLKMTKQAAECSSSMEKPSRTPKEASILETYMQILGIEEPVAIKLTSLDLDQEEYRPSRKLVNFVFHDADGEPFEISTSSTELLITGVILPMDDNFEKEKERGVRCDSFGPIKSWTISGYEEGQPDIWVSTENADYACSRPDNIYKRLYNHFWEKGRVCIEVYKMLEESNRGNGNLTLDELIAGVIRNMSGNRSFLQGLPGREFVISVGGFVYNQLAALDRTSERNDLKLATLPALVALREECKNAEESKMSKQGAECSSSMGKPPRPPKKASILEMQMEHIEIDEDDALALTCLDEDQQDIPARELVDFIFHDVDGNSQPVEMHEVRELFITGLILPKDDNLEKEKERGVICDGFGPIESLLISGYQEGYPDIWVSTEKAEYHCSRPANAYKKLYNHFLEKACVCIEVYKKVKGSNRRNGDLTLDELIDGVIRNMSGNKCFPRGLAGREFVISVGGFVYEQLADMDAFSDNNDLKLTTLPALVALREECKNREESNKLHPNIPRQNLEIGEEKNLEVDEGEVEKREKLLQEEENWKLMRQHRNQGQLTSTNKFYIKINEAEIADDYPLPAYYKPSVQEMDEYILFESESSTFYPDELPRRFLHNWSLYNSDLRLISLELLPMTLCEEIDTTIFGSGNMREDDGGGYSLEDQAASSASDSIVVDGIPVYLSAIKEWMIEFESSMLLISIRTDMAWYMLGRPAKHYTSWYEPVLKTVRLAINIITMLKEESRFSKLSFADVIKKVSELAKDNPAHISSNLVAVERFVVVHGQIILQQFAEYSDKMIQKCAFVTGLAEKMQERRHTKLVTWKKVIVQKEVNFNPSAAMAPALSKRKVMRATMTRLINRLWGDYYSTYMPNNSKKGDGNELKEHEELKEEQEENADEDMDTEEEEENILIQEENSLKFCSPNKSCKSESSSNEIKWEGKPTGNMDSGEVLYKRAMVRGDTISVGGAVMVESNETIVFVEYMFEKFDGLRMGHGRVMQRGSQTVLGNAANERELFLTNECTEFKLGDIKESVILHFRSMPGGHKYKKEIADAHMIDRAKAEGRKRKGLAMEFYCKSLYWHERGAFFNLPLDSLGLGTGECNSCRIRENQIEDLKVKLNSVKASFVYKKREYSVNDFVYVRPQHFRKEDDHATFKSGRNIGLKAYVVGQLLEIEIPQECKQPTPESTHVKIRRFYRPEDVSAAKAYRSDVREVYYSEEIFTVPVEIIEGKCEVRKKNNLPNLDLPVIVDHFFFCEYSYDAAGGAIKQLPANVKFMSQTGKTADTASRKNKGKAKCGEEKKDEDQFDEFEDVPRVNRLATLDVFAGCGGLSEGLQQSGVSCTKWAIEYEQPAAEAFQRNHPESLTFIDNCNVILRAIMEKFGDADDCISTSEATELAAAIEVEKFSNLPGPGQVDFITGGPPCQGFSGMNRFNQNSWSKVQCEMILTFLSFADYFRPRFFLLENVRNFVSFNKGQTFRLTIASLLEMGYQVRFGILEPGAYGISQSRKRAFIWAASPDETLPEWPEPMHVFAGQELKISLPKGLHYAVIHSTAGGAPFRSITVKDTIGDLPQVLNGASKEDIDYRGDPVSWFQKQIRGSMHILRNHISKEMNELNLIRCLCIPKHPGADWRSLPDEKIKLSNGQAVDLIPWCLPNTAKTHNQWKGLFGRLDWDGNFPTSITDPQPMGKIGMCFHPEQNRILTVRECARSQGFPDSYYFSGNIQSMHRQIGNAVPPPLAYALGRKLKEVVDVKRFST